MGGGEWWGVFAGRGVFVVGGGGGCWGSGRGEAGDDGVGVEVVDVFARLEVGWLVLGGEVGRVGGIEDLGEGRGCAGLGGRCWGYGLWGWGWRL